MWKRIGLGLEKIKFVDLRHHDVGVPHVKGTGTVNGGAAENENVFALTGIRRPAEAGAERGDIGPSHQ
jgi:hypothetical protein